MFSIFGHKKDKYPVHHEDHVVHNTGCFSSFKDSLSDLHQKVKEVLDKVNKQTLDSNSKNQHTILDFKEKNITLVLGNYRGLALSKKYAHPESPKQDKNNYTWEICWLSYGFDYSESTVYKWYIADLPKVMTTEVFRDITAVVSAANSVVTTDSSVQFNRLEIRE